MAADGDEVDFAIEDGAALDINFDEVLHVETSPEPLPKRQRTSGMMADGSASEVGSVTGNSSSAPPEWTPESLTECIPIHQMCKVKSCQTKKRKGSKYCPPHHRAQSNLQFMTFPGGKLPKPKAKAKGKGKAKRSAKNAKNSETQEASSSEEAGEDVEQEEQLTAEQVAYFKIFGRPCGRGRVQKGDDDVEDEVLSRYLQLYPDESAVIGTQRGDI